MSAPHSERHGDIDLAVYIVETRILELLATIDAACDRMRAARTEDPIVQAIFLCEEFGKIVEAARLYDAAVEAQL